LHIKKMCLLHKIQIPFTLPASRHRDIIKAMKKFKFIRKVNSVKIYKSIAVAAVMSLCLGVLSGCTTFDNFKQAFIDKPQDQKVTLQIGVYEPMTGADKEKGELEVKGIELAHEMYPTVNGKIVELVYADNASDIYAAETAIKELIYKEPTVILGSYGSVYSLVAGNYISEAEIPAIAMTNTNPLVTRNNPYYFRVCYVDSNQGDVLAKYLLKEKKEKKAGVLLPSGDDAAMAMATAFTDRIKAETKNEDAITVYEEYKAGASDFSKQLEAVKKSGVKSVLLAGDVVDSSNIIKQAKKMGLKTVFLGDSDWTGEEFEELVGSGLEGTEVAFVNFFSADEVVSKETEKFLRFYKEKYGENSEPEDGVALGYDAYIIALNAIDKADDDATSAEVAKVLKEQREFEGASGLITFSATGDPIKTAYISTWQEGKIVTLHTMEPM